MAGSQIWFRGKWVDLDAHRRAKAQSKVRTYEWRMTRAHWHRLCELIEQLKTSRDGSNEHMAILDDMKSIPGYPQGCRDHDMLRPVITDATVM
jgi:hypothetical protein